MLGRLRADVVHRGQVDRRTIRGSFTQVIWQGLADGSGTVPDFGVRVISLVE